MSRRCVDLTVVESAGRRVPAEATAVVLFGLMLAADAVGCVEEALARTVAYAGERFAFGRPIGGFQAVQHRLVDHVVRTRGLTLAVAEAARLLTNGHPEGARAARLAQVSVSGAATHILHDLLQLTGGIGFTWEYGLHHHERRAHQDARIASNPRTSIEALIVSEGWRRD